MGVDRHAVGDVTAASVTEKEQWHSLIQFVTVMTCCDEPAVGYPSELGLSVTVRNAWRTDRCRSAACVMALD
jgi:hypothetical protein